MNQRAASGLSISLPTLRPKLPRWLPFLAIAIAIAIAAGFGLLTSTTMRSTAKLPTPAAASVSNVPGSPVSESLGSDAIAAAIPVVSDRAGRTLPTTVGGLLTLPAIERIRPGPVDAPSDVPPGTAEPLPTGSTSAPAPARDCPTWNLIGPWFDPDQATPHPDAWALLADIAAELRQTNLPIRIVGHTDIRTTAFLGGNQGLSEARAQAVLDQLVTMDISPNRMAASGRGASELVNTGTTEFAHQQNRRVVVALICKS